MVHNAVVMYGTFTGIGSPDSKLNTAIMIEGAKVSRKLPIPACFQS